LTFAIGFSSHSSRAMDMTESYRYYLLCKAQHSDNNSVGPITRRDEAPKET
jgi:hypothetical protein